VVPEPVEIFCGELDPLADDAGTMDAVIDGGGAATERILLEADACDPAASLAKEEALERSDEDELEELLDEADELDDAALLAAAAAAAEGLAPVKD